MRLFDSQFGTRGLSIMHLVWLNTVEKMEWITASSVNMQNFSHSVALPTPLRPRSLDNVSKALLSLCSYCSTFASTETTQFAQGLF